jgi:hypothetical protein
VDFVLLILLTVASDDGVVRELKKYRSRVEYTNQGSCDCFYVKLAEREWDGIAKPLRRSYVFSELAFRMLPEGEVLVSPNLNLRRIKDAPQRILPLVADVKAKPPDAKVDWTIRRDPPRIGRFDLESFRGGKEIPKNQHKRTENVPLWGLAHSPGNGGWYWGIGYKGGPRFFDPSGGGSSPNAKLYAVVYNPADWALRLRVEGKYRKYAWSRLLDQIVWLDDRYLIFPATRQQEIVYICDLATERRN